RPRAVQLPWPEGDGQGGVHQDPEWDPLDPGARGPGPHLRGHGGTPRPANHGRRLQHPGRPPVRSVPEEGHDPGGERRRPGRLRPGVPRHVLQGVQLLEGGLQRLRGMGAERPRGGGDGARPGPGSGRRVRGHAHPDFVPRIQDQAARLTHTASVYPTLEQVTVAERLTRITPGKLKKSFFTTSGTEADETAVMLAKIYTGQQEIIALRHAYAG